MTTFHVPGADLDVELSDEGGAPVVQLHGLTSSRRRDRQLNLDLGTGLHGTRLLRYDARGHGRSTGRTVPDDYRWTSLADDLLRLLDAWFPGERVHGVGPSMGAGTLLHAAVRDPGRFSGFTLMLPPTAWDTRAAKAEEYRVAADLVESRGIGAFVALNRLKPSPPAAKRLPDSLPEVSEALFPTVFRGAAASDLPDPEQIARIDVPTTLLAWIDDPGHPVSTAERLHGLLPHSTLTIASTPADVGTWPGVLRDDVAHRS
ncbi:alpha/beta hydrolase [Pseudoclavibacter chungangensis]|uniref:Alpha/beta hydrolase n=1 Tax=Pseudoclavibacter chungangensis TaxID=587635 RepID=A0A7J5BPL7_9MICO|nr:alpha/beta hydrolase [Pseudoclavibacter chungangensis]KAB1654053.1 alpha/beta hydrolase [Pseudoclavibacter chungangensis]NYJ66037.1 pimeloyl-ACP methyl ester carboxylesterase [Pseudoclavibacter chungangensis]